LILAGDIGGTKTALGLYTGTSIPPQAFCEEVFSSPRYENLEEITSEFLSRARPGPIEAACFAVAGPIIDGSASVTNLSWHVRSSSLAAHLDITEIKLINDVQAVASSIPFLGRKELRVLNIGNPTAEGTAAVVAAGTGLGEGFLTRDGADFQSHPSEGGHADFGPANEEQSGLLLFMRRKTGHVSWEAVCSGIGIYNIYQYLKSTGDYEDALGIEKDPAFAGDPTPVITGAALAQDAPNRLCADTLGMFISILGAESGNLALKTMATGGLYLGGGIPPRILNALEGKAFMKAFTAKGRLSGMMNQIPVYVILNPGAALLGASIEAFRMLKRGTNDR